MDIDAHHGDGVFYAFESEPAVIIADLHEDGRFLYPGTGRIEETGTRMALGSKLNVPLAPGANDAAFARAWEPVIPHLERYQPEFIILQCGADSMGGDPITHLALTEASHARAARTWRRWRSGSGHGRLLALGGGGYNRGNIARGWNAVVEALLQS